MKQNKFIDAITKRFPYLKHNLAQAGMNIKEEDFIKKQLLQALIITTTLTITLLFVIIKSQGNYIFVPLAFIVFYVILFLFLINTPKAIIRRKIREIDREITYAGRFLLIELHAGVPLFDALKNVANNFEGIGKHFQDVINRVEVGKPIEQALNEVMEITPSDNFRRLLFSIVNSLRTGAEVTTSLDRLVEQISREKLIKIKEYGKKLNPVVMFYLILAVIAPSLGVAVLTLLSSFLGLGFNLSSLLTISFAITLIQLVFISIVDSMRRGI